VRNIINDARFGLRLLRNDHESSQHVLVINETMKGRRFTRMDPVRVIR
jgi:hypothetical protein